MTTWADVERAEAGFATVVRALFDAHRHKTIATLRADGSPRISGIEATFGDGELSFGSMTGSRKGSDLRRDPRFALHSATVDPVEGSEADWCTPTSTTGPRGSWWSGGRPRTGCAASSVTDRSRGSPPRWPRRTTPDDQETGMDMKLELVLIPVADVDRAKAFYVDRMGFVEDVDVRPADGVRVVQLTPPGSACSLGLGSGLAAYDEMVPGTVKALHLVVADIDRARTELLGRGVEVGAVLDVGGGVRYAGFSDPDGNTWTLQEMAWRTGDAS